MNIHSILSFKTIMSSRESVRSRFPAQCTVCTGTLGAFLALCSEGGLLRNIFLGGGSFYQFTTVLDKMLAKPGLRGLLNRTINDKFNKINPVSLGGIETGSMCVQNV